MSWRSRGKRDERPRAGLAALLGAVLATCVSCGLNVPNLGTRGSLSVVDTYEFDVSALGYTGSEDGDYSSIEFGVFARVEDGDGDRVGTLDASVGLVNLYDFKAVEWNLGGRVYFLQSRGLRPFAGLSWVATAFNDTRIDFVDVDLGVMQSVRFGVGAEVVIVDQLFFDVVLDYSVPFAAADVTAIPPPPFPSVDGELETEGLALRIGIGIDF